MGAAIRTRVALCLLVVASVLAGCCNPPRDLVNLFGGPGADLGLGEPPGDLGARYDYEVPEGL